MGGGVKNVTLEQEQASNLISQQLAVAKCDPFEWEGFFSLIFKKKA